MPNLYNNLTGNYAILPYNVAISSGSVVVKTGEGLLFGIMISDVGNTPRLSVYDLAATTGTTTANTIMATFTPIAGTLYRFGAPIKFSTGLALLSTGSVGATIVYY